MSDALTVSHRPASAVPVVPAVHRRTGRLARVALVLGVLLLAALALGLLAGHHLQGLAGTDWPLEVWVNGEQVGGAWREQLAGSGLGTASALGLGLVTLVLLAVLLPLLLGLTVALPLLLVGLVLLGVAIGLVALMGMPLLVLGLVALPLLVPLLLLWWLVRWLLR